RSRVPASPPRAWPPCALPGNRARDGRGCPCRARRSACTAHRGCARSRACCWRDPQPERLPPPRATPLSSRAKRGTFLLTQRSLAYARDDRVRARPSFLVPLLDQRGIHHRVAVARHVGHLLVGDVLGGLAVGGTEQLDDDVALDLAHQHAGAVVDLRYG